MQETIDKIQSDLSYSKNLLSAWVDRAGQVLDQQIPNPGTLSLDTIEQELNQLENEVQVAEELLLSGYTPEQLHERLSELQNEIAEAGQKTIAEWQADTAQLEAQLEPETPSWDTEEIRELVFRYDSQVQELIEGYHQVEGERVQLERQAKVLSDRESDLKDAKTRCRNELDNMSQMQELYRARTEILSMTQRAADLRD